MEPTPPASVPEHDGRFRKHVKMWCKVAIVLKKDQKTGKRTIGYVRGILTSKEFHSRGIKVILHTRQIGRVQEILSTEPLPYEKRV